MAGSNSGKVTGLVISDIVYLKTPVVTKSFVKDEDPLDEYDPKVNEQTKSLEQKKLAILWTSWHEKQAQIAATKHGYRQLILNAFDELYYVIIRNEDTFYKTVSTLALLSHIADAIGGLGIANVVALLAKLPD